MILKIDLKGTVTCPVCKLEFIAENGFKKYKNKAKIINKKATLRGICPVCDNDFEKEFILENEKCELFKHCTLRSMP